MTTKGTGVTAEAKPENVTEPVATTAVPVPPVQRGFYARLLRDTPRGLIFVLLGMPIATAGFAVTLSLFNAGIGTIIPIFIGVFILIGAMYAARGFATLELTRLGWAGQPPIQRVDWEDRRSRDGFWLWLRSILLNGHYWLALLHSMVVNFAVSLFSWTLVVSWLASGLGGLTYWFWDRFIPKPGLQLYVSQWVFDGKGMVPVNASYEVWDSIFYLAWGVIFIVTLPFIVRGMVKMHWGVAASMLGAWKSDQLRIQVRDLNAARGAASAAEGHSLRRLERDIHDGPQQRLVRMQMDLAAADRQLDDDPTKARTLIAEAMQQSKDALEELRALSRGFAPPILLDRGLVAALESAATRSPIHTRVVNKLAVTVKIPQEIERNAYFAASEALTNAIKHSGATEIEIRVSKTTDALVITVTDNGIGGALPTPGHGLAGLDERMRGSGGTLEVHSPDGGPTFVSAKLPLA